MNIQGGAVPRITGIAGAAGTFGYPLQNTSVLARGADNANGIKKQTVSAGENFASVMEGVMERMKTSSTEKPAAFSGGAKISEAGKLSGDIQSAFDIINPTPADKAASPKGAAAGTMLAKGADGKERKIDKTSELYKQALELESFFVKIMTDSMKKTLSGKTLSGEETFAEKMYKDMMYGELNRTLTKNANFGLADQIYLQLSR